MRELRLILLSGLLALPLCWSATLVAETRTETINQVLSALMIGILPLLAMMLAWEENFRGADVDVRYGASRRVFVAKSLARSAMALVVFSLVASLGSIATLRGPRDPLLMSDLIATAQIGFVASISMITVFFMGRAWLGKVGLVLVLVLLWALGPLSLPIAATVPTGHVRHLLGLGVELPFPPWVSFASLYGMALVAAAALFARVPR